MSKAVFATEAAPVALSEVTLIHPYRIPGTNEMYMHVSSQKGFKIEDVGNKIRITKGDRSALVPWANVVGAVEP